MSTQTETRPLDLNLVETIIANTISNFGDFACIDPRDAPDTRIWLSREMAKRLNAAADSLEWRAGR